METEADFLGRGFAFPFSVREGRAESSEGEQCIRESIMLILGTARGERVMRPDFGCDINSLVFEVNNTSTATLVSFHVEEALKKWEPRIDLINVTAFPDEEEKNRLNIDIEYEIRTSNRKANLVYPFYLEGGAA